MMGGYIIRSVLHKSKKQLALIFLFMFLSALLLNLWLMLTTDYKQNFFRTLDRTNGEHIIIGLQKTAEEGQTEKIAAVLEDYENKGIIESFSLTETATVYSTFPYGEGDFSLYMSLFSLSEATSRTVGRMEISEDCGGSGVYVPYYYKANGYAVGDSYSFTFGTVDLTYPIVGFYQATSGGTASGSKNMPMILSDDLYDAFFAANRKASVIASIRLKDLDIAEQYETVLVSETSSAAGNLKVNFSSYYQRFATGRYSIEVIFAGILGSATVISVAVLLTVIAICLSGYVKDNTRNFGMMKATGYISRQILMPILLAFGCISLLISAVGVGVSYAVFPLLNAMLERQVGMEYSLHFLPIPALLGVLAVVAVVLPTVYLSIRKIRFVKPLEAIRSREGNGFASHSFPLDKTSLPVSLSLAFKSTVSGVGRNAVIFISMFLISLLLGFACFCYQYVILNPNSVLQLVFEDESDASLCVDAENVGDLIDAAKADPRVTEFYLRDAKEIFHIGESNVTAYVGAKETAVAMESSLLSGRYPVNADEVAVNRFYAELRGLSVGDEMTFGFEGKTASYRIVGLTQGARYSGRNIFLLSEGLEKLGKAETHTYYFKLKSDADPEAFMREMSEKVSVLLSVNTRKERASLSADYASMLTGLAVVLIVLSLGITAFVLYILIAMLLGQKKREHGILKALGFETRQIILQTAVSLMPASFVATVFGFALSRNAIGTFLTSMLNGIGIFAFAHPIAVGYLAVGAVGLLLFTFGTSCLMSAKIRKITPHSLFNNE